MNSASGMLGYIGRRLWLILLVAAIVIGLDQWTKELVRQSLPKFVTVTPIPELAPYLLFQHVDNYGAAFGILQGLGGFFVVVAAIVSIVIIVYAVRSLPPNQTFIRVLLGMQMGGALGNVVDRLTQGYVTDFVLLGIPGIWYIPNFNVADNAIVFGVIGLAALLIWDDYKSSRQKPEQPENNTLLTDSIGSSDN